MKEMKPKKRGIEEWYR